MTSTEGTMSATVWPSYVGFVDAFGVPSCRAQINWLTEDGEVVGHAVPLVAVGEWTHVAFYTHPAAALVLGLIKLDHPLVLAAEQYVELYPIRNSDLSLHQQQREV